MKRMRKIASILLAMVMVLSMSMTVFATELGGGTGDSGQTTSPTNNEDEGSESRETPASTTPTITHHYQIYQIFTGDISTDDAGVKKLSNVRWGQNGMGEAGTQVPQTVLDALEAVRENPSDQAKLDVIKQYAKLPQAQAGQTIPEPIAQGSGTEYTGLAQGYYLIMDAPGSLDNQDGSAYTLYVVQLDDADGVLRFTPKADVPHGDKQTYVVNPDGSTTPYSPSDMNYGTIGSHVSYVITSEVPNHTNYNYYYFVMNDTLDPGLVFDGASSVTVKVNGTAITQGSQYYVYTGDAAAPYSFRLAFNNIKEFTVGASIEVTYSATITSDVQHIGVEGNANTWRLQYSNNPNENYGGNPDTTNPHPGLPLEEEEDILGQTAEHKTLTFLTELDIVKYADEVAQDHLLNGAVFTLSGTSHQVVLNQVKYYRVATDAEKADDEIPKFYKLLAVGADGEQYTQTAPTGIKFVRIGVGTRDTTAGYLLREGVTSPDDNPDNYYVPDNTNTDTNPYEGKDVYKKVKGTASNYADVNVVYVKDSENTTSVVPVDVSIEMTTAGDDENAGRAVFRGIGAGTYTLTETVTPPGYNTLAPITITVTCNGLDATVSDGSEHCSWGMTADNGQVINENTQTVDGNTLGLGIFTAEILNHSGSLLPSTGGIGTTIFYVVGGILVIGAGILLVAKKRMGNRR